MDDPIILSFEIVQFERALILRPDQKVDAFRRAPSGYDRMDFQAFPLPVECNWPIGVGLTGETLDSLFPHLQAPISCE